MPAVPRFVARINKRMFNPREIRKGNRPVLMHTGRTSGAEYRTPLDAHRVEDGFVFVVMYGAQSDWVRNVVASGVAKLRIGGATYDLIQPRLISRNEATGAVEAEGGGHPRLAKRAEFLRMDLSTE